MVPNFRLNGPLELIFDRNLSFITIIILPSFIEIGQELFEIIEVKTHRQTHTQTDTYTRMKIIPVQKQSFWAR